MSASLNFLFGRNLSFFVLLLAGIPARAQWTPLSTGSAYNQYDIFALDAQRLFVGGVDALMKSANGGQSWTTLPLLDESNAPIYNSTLQAIHFFDENTGVATGFMLTGNVEVILRTTDGGQHWKMVHVQTGGTAPKFLTDFSFPTPGVGYACGNRGVILKTENAGVSWTPVQLPSSSGTYSGIFFTDPINGYIAGSGKILRTVNGGETWTTQFFTGKNFNAVHFPSASWGYAVGESGIMATTNGGDNWTAPVVQPLHAGALTDVFFLNDTVGFTLDAEGKMYKTRNGGQLWEKTALTNPTTCRRFFFQNANNAWVVGDQGKVWKTTNGGGAYAPIAGFTGGGICALTPYTYNNLTTPTPNYTYEWQLNGETVSTDFHASISFPAPGATYTLSLIADNGTASDTVVKQFQIAAPYPYPTGNLHITPALPCAGAMATLQYDSVWIGQNYRLYRNGALVISNWVSTWGDPLVSTQSIPNDPVTFVITTTFFDGCNTTLLADTLHIVPAQNANAVQVSADKTQLCPGDSTLIRVSPVTQPGNYYRVTVNGSGKVLGTLPGNGGELTFPTGPVGNGISSVNLQVFNPDAGCNSSKNVTLFTVKSVLASTYPGHQLLTGQPLTLENYSQNSVSWHWYFGPDADPAESDQKTPTVTYSTEGMHTFLLEATAAGGCVDSFTGYIETYKPADWNTNGVFCAEQAPEVPHFFWYLDPRIRDAQSDPAGNFYLAGFVDTATQNLHEYGIVRKMDAAGKVLWEKRFIPNFWVEFEAGGSVRCILVENDPETGNVWVAGEVRSRTFWVDDLKFSLGENTLRFFLAKINASGQILWVNILENNAEAGPNNMIYAGKDRLYLCQFGYGGTIRYGNGKPSENWGISGISTDAYFLVFDEAGALAYRKNIGKRQGASGYLDHRLINSYNLPAFRGAPDMKFTDDGKLLFYGAADNDFLLDDIPLNVIPGAKGAFCGFFALWDTTSRQWVQGFPVFGLPTNPNGSVSWDETMFNPGFGSDGDGNVYLYFGQQLRNFQGDPEPTYEGYGDIFLPDGSKVPGAGKHSFLMKFGPQGELLWCNVNGAAEPIGLDVLPNGAVVGVANFFQFAGLVSQNGAISGYPGQGWRDWMYTLWSPEGNLQFARSFGTPKFDEAYLLRSKGCGRQLLLHSSNTQDNWGLEAAPLLGIFSPSGDCSGAVNGCIVDLNETARPSFALHISPNPNNGTFSTTLPRPASAGMSLRVTDLAGRLILEKQAEEGYVEQTVAIAGLPAGMYFLQVLADGKALAVERFVKE